MSAPRPSTPAEVYDPTASVQGVYMPGQHNSELRGLCACPCCEDLPMAVSMKTAK